MRRPRSIRTRLLLALMLMTLLTLTIATGLSALMDLKLFRDHMLRDLQVLAAVVGENCVSALVFDSPTSAERNLATLAREYQMLAQIEQREAALDQANRTLRRLATDLSLLQETEKARLAAELHDGPMQKLALAQMQIDAAAGLDKDDDADGRNEAAQQHAAGVELMREAIAELRTLQFDLSPPVLHKRGLSAALDWLASNTRERWCINLRYAADAGLPALSRQQSVILFQCARELVHNLIKHSGASSGMIRLTADAEGLELTVQDNGRGFDATNTGRDSSTSGSGYGLYSVRERLQLLGGKLEIESVASGSLLLIRLPLPEV